MNITNGSTQEQGQFYEKKWGAWPLIILEATTAKRNYYTTNDI